MSKPKAERVCLICGRIWENVDCQLRVCRRSAPDSLLCRSEWERRYRAKKNRGDYIAENTAAHEAQRDRGWTADTDMDLWLRLAEGYTAAEIARDTNRDVDRARERIARLLLIGDQIIRQNWLRWSTERGSENV